jgi:hypothetical protein
MTRKGQAFHMPIHIFAVAGYVLCNFERPERFKNAAKRLFPLRDSLNGNQGAQKRLRADIDRSKKPCRIKAQSIVIDKAAAATKSRRRFAHRGRQREAIRLMEQGAVPACDLANRMWAVRKLARPATTPVYQELVARGADRLSATMKRETGPSRGLKNLGECRDGAPKGERARKRMPAVTRTIRGARRTG